MIGNSRPAVVVAGIDGSGEALVAAQWAAQEARRRHLSLRLVHSYTVPIVGYPGYAFPPDMGEAVVAAGQHLLDRVARTIAGTEPELDISTSLVHADPRKALVEASGVASLTVIGSRGHGRIPEVLLGSVALHVAAHGRSPVAIVPPGFAAAENTSKGPVLLGVDASANSEAAVRFAFDEAAVRGVDLIAALVWDDAAIRGFVRGATRIGDFEIEEAHAVLSEQIAGWVEKYPDVAVRQVVLRGRPAKALLDYGLGLPTGRHPQAMIVGSHGRGGLTGMILGSTSQGLITHAIWPVMVVRPDIAE